MDVFPNRLKTRRKQLNWTQDQLAQIAGTTIANISNYEHGNQKPSANMLYRLAQALDCSIDYLLGLSDQADLSQNKKTIPANELIHRYTVFINNDALDKEEVDEMLEYIQIRKLMEKDTD